MIIRIYLDIDGVINSFSRNPPRNNTGWTGEWGSEQVYVNDSKDGRVRAYPILWSVELIEHLNEIIEMDGVQFVILSSWQDHAITELAPVIGLDASESWDVLHPNDDEDMYTHGDTWWKFRAIKEDIKLNNPDKIVWLEDALRFQQNAVKWINELGPDKILGIGPYSTHGLTKKHIHAIIDFIEAEEL